MAIKEIKYTGWHPPESETELFLRNFSYEWGPYYTAVINDFGLQDEVIIDNPVKGPDRIHRDFDKPGAFSISINPDVPCIKTARERFWAASTTHNDELIAIEKGLPF